MVWPKCYKCYCLTAHTFIHTQAYIHTYTHTYSHMDTHTWAQRHIQTHIQTHGHIHTHGYLCFCFCCVLNYAGLAFANRGPQLSCNRWHLSFFATFNEAKGHMSPHLLLWILLCNCSVIMAHNRFRNYLSRKQLVLFNKLRCNLVNLKKIVQRKYSKIIY